MVDGDAEPLSLEMVHPVHAEELGRVRIELHHLPGSREQEVGGVSARAECACALDGQARGEQSARASFEVQALETVCRTVVSQSPTVDVDLWKRKELSVFVCNGIERQWQVPLKLVSWCFEPSQPLRVTSGLTC